MAYLLDTNILLRSVQPDHSMYEHAVGAVETLLTQGETLYIVPQNVREFWNVCTRPVMNNGLGLTPMEASAEIGRLEATLSFAPDSAANYTEWRRLVETYSITGLQVHDTNLVAAMNVHGITHLLTFNSAHFTRFTAITVRHPVDIITVGAI